MMTKRRSPVLFAAALLAPFGLLLACSNTDAGTVEVSAPLLPVSSIVVEEVEGYTRNRIYTGELEARRTVELGFDSSGLVTELHFEEGNHIEAGQRLAHLDTARIEAQRVTIEARRDQARAVLAELRAGPRREVVAVARAALSEIEEEIELARARLARREELIVTNAISREALDEAERGLAVLETRFTSRTHALEELISGTREEKIAAQEATVRSFDAELGALALEVKKSTLLAPFAGTVAFRYLDEGAVVRAGEAMLRLVESEVLEARFGLPPAAARKLTEGEVHTLRVGDVELSASVLAILPELDPRTRTATVVLSIDDGEGAVIAGEIAEFVITEEISERGSWLPVSALARSDRGLWSSFALIEVGEARHRVERREVEVLHTEGERVLVRGTLEAGDRVIESGVTRVVPGQEVRLSESDIESERAPER
jgi:multidrug efflux pump subunit AcrA (membrane-fusion protein)